MKFRRVFKPFLAVLIFWGWLGSGEAAIFDTPCVDELTGVSNGCTANDIGVQDISIVWVGKGCVYPGDNATVRMNVSLSAANADRFDPGIYVNTHGDASAVTATPSRCLHEALFPVTATAGSVSPYSGLGPYYDMDGDVTGDVNSSQTLTRSIVEGDIGSTTLAEFNISCADNTANGYVDFAWSVTYATRANALVTTRILDTVPSAKSKCTSGTSDTYLTVGSIQIGLPNMSVQISCTPTTLDIGQKSTCTATYLNSSTNGPGDYLKFKITYPASEGSVVGDINKSSAGESAVDDGSGTIDWTMAGGQTSANIAPLATATITFDYLYTGGADFNISIDTFYDNGTDPEVNENLQAVEAFTTLPVTIGYVDSSVRGDRLSLQFETVSETSNMGFNVYAVKGKRWIRLNKQPIAGSLDSFEPVDYDVTLPLPECMKLKKIGIAGVNKDGREDRHGPYRVGKTEGTKAVVEAVDWTKVKKQLAAKKNPKSGMAKIDTTSTGIVLLDATAAKSLKEENVYFEVPKKGVYRVTGDDLSAHGIVLKGIKTENIALTLQGKGVPRHIDNAPKGRWSASSTLSFLGVPAEGEDALYTDVNRYKLSLSKKKAVESGPIAPLTSVTDRFEANRLYSYSLPQDDPFYDGYFYARGDGHDGKLTRTFTMPELPEGTSVLTLYLSGYSDGDHELRVLVNGTAVADEKTTGWTKWTIKVPVDNALLKAGSNSLELVIPNRDGVFDFVVYDKLTVTYEPIGPVGTLSPTVVTEAKVKRSGLKPANGTDFVIVSHPLFIGDDLQRFVDARRGEGWTVDVVDVEDIYKAFGDGLAKPEALRKYFASLRESTVSHVLLVGASTYDYHDFLQAGAVSFIPSAYARTGQLIHYTPCDTCFVMNKNEIPRLAIGRWPVRTLEELSSVVNKTLDWTSSGQCKVGSALLIADKTDKGMVFGEQMDHIAAQLQDYGVNNISKVYLDDLVRANDGDLTLAVTQARAAITAALENGATLISYSGHSSPTLWSFYGLLKQDDIAKIDNVDKTTIALPLACFSTYADSPYTNTIAHQMLVAGEKGAVALYGATMRSSYGDNEVASKLVIDAFMKGQTIGQAILNSKRTLGSRYNDLIKNNNLLGDPTLRMCGKR